MHLLCRLGFHQRKYTTKYIPHIMAPIVTRVITTRTCNRCGLEKIVWDQKLNEITDEFESQLLNN